MPGKGDLRREYLVRRRTISTANRRAWDAAIAGHVLALPEVAQADTVLTYISVATETDTLNIIEALLGAGTRVLAPQMRDDMDDMRWGEVRSLTELDRGLFGIPQPSAELDGPPPPDAPVLVPCVAYTANGERLGRGGGHFDRFLTTHRGPRIGLAYADQQADTLPIEPHDITLDVIVNENGPLRTK